MVRLGHTLALRRKTQTLETKTKQKPHDCLYLKSVMAFKTHHSPSIQTNITSIHSFGPEVTHLLSGPSTPSGLGLR